VTVSVQRPSGPYWLFSSLGSYCLLQSFGTVTAGAFGDSCVAGGSQRIAEAVGVCLTSDCLITHPALARGCLGGCDHQTPLGCLVHGTAISPSICCGNPKGLLLSPPWRKKQYSWGGNSRKLHRGGERYSGLSQVAGEGQHTSALLSPRWPLSLSACRRVLQVGVLRRGAVPANAACVPPPAPAPCASSRVWVVCCPGR